MFSLLGCSLAGRLLPAPRLTSCPWTPDFLPPSGNQACHSERSLLNPGLPPYSSEPQLSQGPGLPEGESSHPLEILARVLPLTLVKTIFFFILLQRIASLWSQKSLFRSRILGLLLYSQEAHLNIFPKQGKLCCYSQLEGSWPQKLNQSLFFTFSLFKFALLS